MTKADITRHAQLGAINHLRVVREKDFGVYLDGLLLGEILLPRRYVPSACKVGDTLAVFVYKDSEDRLIATTDTPYVQVGECACLKVVDVNAVGAFLNWGLPKDLFVPHSEQNGRMEPGRSYVVNVYIDESTERIAATAKLDGWLSENGLYFKPYQAVDLLIYGQTELGYKAVINHTHIGLLYKNEVFQEIHYGQKLPGFIKSIRPDKKIDLCLQRPAKETLDALMQDILRYLQDNNGRSTITDKSPPQQIYDQFKVSKKNYKKALGRLYRERKIEIHKDCVLLVKL